MADLVGVYAASHGPLIARDWDRLPDALKQRLSAAYGELGRCFAWGRLLRRAVADYPRATRVAILATGGLSHSIGEPSMGTIDEDFDRRCLGAFERGEEAPLIEILEDGAATAGNGTHEIRNW